MSAFETTTLQMLRTTPLQMPRPDIARLRKAVEWVECQAQLPEVDREWYQRSYRASGRFVGRSCGTCFCVAGKVCDDAGIVWDAYEDADEGVLDGVHGDADAHAIGLLGLTAVEANRLFDGTNSAARVRYVAEEIAARAGERL